MSTFLPHTNSKPLAYVACYAQFLLYHLRLDIPVLRSFVNSLSNQDLFYPFPGKSFTSVRNL